MTPSQESDGLEVDAEVVELVGGPCDGEQAEVPIGYVEIWRCHAGGPGDYSLYNRVAPSERELCFAGRTLTMDQLAAEIVEKGVEPVLHVEGSRPRARRLRFRR